MEQKEDYLALKSDVQTFIMVLNKFGFNSQALLLSESKVLLIFE